MGEWGEIEMGLTEAYSAPAPGDTACKKVEWE